jgi:hypothetical protein
VTVELHRGCQFCGHPTTDPAAVCGSPRCRYLAAQPTYVPDGPALQPTPGRRVVIVRPRKVLA